MMETMKMVRSTPESGELLSNKATGKERPTDMAQGDEAHSKTKSARPYFFPSREMLESRSRYDSGRQTLTLPKDAIRKILLDLYSAYGFDEADYLGRYEDVKKAIDNGDVESSLRHFCETGFFEGRIANLPDFEEEYYLRRNPDVWKAIEKGDVGLAYDHYVLNGIAEGRAANAEIDAVIASWLNVL
jgi:hypothetical protein